MNDELICKVCGYPNEAEHQFCRTCGTATDLFGDIEEQDTSIAIVTDSLAKTVSVVNHLFTCGVITFIFLLIISVPTFPSRHRHRTHSRKKSCQANMRVILGAVEMYNMDHVPMFDTYNDETWHYLSDYMRGNEPLRCPEDGKYYGENLSSGIGRISCTEHGSI